MAKLMIAGWSGKKPNSARFVTVRGSVSREDVKRDYTLRRTLIDHMYGMAGAVWDITGKFPILLCTWYMDVNGNHVIRDKVEYN